MAERERFWAAFELHAKEAHCSDPSLIAKRYPQESGIIETCVLT